MNPRGYIAPSVRIDHPKLRTGKNAYLAENVQIIKIEGGEELEIHGHVHVHDNCRLLTGYGARAIIGEGTHIQLDCYLYACKSDILIGRAVEIAARCAFYSYDHGFAPGECIMHQPLKSKGPIVVGDGAWLGHGVTVLNGVEIGAGAVVGAGSVVIGDIPENAIAVGVPARVIRYRDDAAE